MNRGHSLRIEQKEQRLPQRCKKHGWQFGVSGLLPVLLSPLWQSQPAGNDDRINAAIAYLPSVISALVLLVIAWIIATILRMIIRRAASLIFRSKQSKGFRVSSAIANSVYVFVFLFALPAVLESLSIGRSWLDALLSSPTRALLILLLLAIAAYAFSSGREKGREKRP